ncbi:hypothetical protein JYT22_00550 [Endomicrobium sp. AH-315-J14]|nr:hypothetical protein [Endomicrobium sp. AH-315-J14]
MPRRPVSRFFMAACCFATAVLSLSGPAAAELKSSDVRLRIGAPSAQGSWSLRIDNAGSEAVRIAADVRLLSFEVSVPAKDGQKAIRASCKGPAAFGIKSFPAGRGVVLEPGHSYVEAFDPRLLCFGKKKSKLLVAGASFTPHYGFAPKPRWRRGPEKAPFAVEGTHDPRKLKPSKGLTGHTFILSSAPPNAPTAPGVPDQRDGNAQGVPGQVNIPAESHEHGGDAHSHEPPAGQADERAPRLAFTHTSFVDALHARDAVVNVQTHNAGSRDERIVVRRRDLSFIVAGPDGRLKSCGRQSIDHAVPVDNYRKVRGKKHIHMRVLLVELCSRSYFERAGLYRVRATVHVDHHGNRVGLDALTGAATTVTGNPGAGGQHTHAPLETLVRIRRGVRPFHLAPPTVVETKTLP